MCVRKSFLSVPFMNQTLGQRWSFTAPGKLGKPVCSLPVSRKLTLQVNTLPLSPYALTSWLASLSISPIALRSCTLRALAMPRAKWNRSLSAGGGSNFLQSSATISVMSYVALSALWSNVIDVSAEVWNLNLSGRSGRWALATFMLFNVVTDQSLSCFNVFTAPPAPTLAGLSIESPPGRFIALMLQSAPFLSLVLARCTLLAIAAASTKVLHIPKGDDSPRNTIHVSLSCPYCIVTTQSGQVGLLIWFAESTSHLGTCFLIPALGPRQEPSIIVFWHKVPLGTHAR